MAASSGSSSPPWRLRLQRSEQYLTSSHTRAHLRRQLKGRPQLAQILSAGVALDMPDFAPAARQASRAVRLEAQ